MGSKGRILVGMDGSEHSFRAMDVAIELAIALDFDITAMRVIAPIDPTYFSAEEVIDCEKEAETSLCSAKDMAEKRGVACAIKKEKGYPAERLINESGSGYDIIVVGSKGASAIERFLLGSVAQRVLEFAHASVLVVP